MHNFFLNTDILRRPVPVSAKEKGGKKKAVTRQRIQAHPTLYFPPKTQDVAGFLTPLPESECCTTVTLGSRVYTGGL